MIDWMTASSALPRSEANDEEAPLQRPALILTLAVAATQDAAYGLVFLSFMNHYLLDVLHSSPGLPGYTLALFGGTKLLFHPIAGRLIDRWSPRGVFRGAIVLQALAAGVMWASGSLEGFLVGSCLLAIGSAALWPLTYEIVGRTQPAQQHSRVTGLLSVVGYAGTGAGMAAGILVANLAGDREIAFSVLLATVAFPLLLSPGSALNRRQHASPNPVEAPVAEPQWTFDRLSGVALFAFVVFVDYAAITSVAGVYGPYVRLTLDITLLKAGLYLAPAGIGAMVGLVAAARLSRPGRRMAEMAVLFVFSAVGALGLASTTEPLVAGLWAISFAIGAGGVGPIVAASMIEQGGNSSPGTVVGTLMSIEGLGAVIGPAVIAAIIDWAGPSAGLVAIGVTFACLAPVSVLAGRHRGLSAAQTSP